MGEEYVNKEDVVAAFKRLKSNTENKVCYFTIHHATKA